MNIRVLVATLSLALAATCCDAAPMLQGRWEGPVQIPGAPLTLVVDLAQDDAKAWTGSVIMPGLGVKGAPAGDIVVDGASIGLTLAGALRAGGAEAPRIKGRLTDQGTLEGDFEQGGNHAPLLLRRTGVAQVEAAPTSTAVAGELVGVWNGQFELGGYPRQVTLTLSNHPSRAASADLVIVGKKTTQVPVDLVVQDQRFLRIESGQMSIVFEGLWQAQSGRIEGSLQVGAFEVPLVLHHGAATPGGKS